MIVYFVGITKNPQDIADSFVVRLDLPNDRSAGKYRETVLDNRIFRSLINIDKKGVKELYEYSAKDDLFPLTRSCETFTDDSVNTAKINVGFVVKDIGVLTGMFR